MTRSIDQPIAVTAVQFTKQFDLIPRRIEIDGVSYELAHDYKRVVLDTGDKKEALLDISDGTRLLRLRQASGLGSWRLIGITV